MAHLNPISLDELKDNATNCRVKRHLQTSSSRQHGRPSEIKPANVICAQEAFQANQGHEFYTGLSRFYKSCDLRRSAINLAI